MIGDFKNSANLEPFLAGGQISSTTEVVIYMVPAASRRMVGMYSDPHAVYYAKHRIGLDLTSVDPGSYVS